MVRTSYKELYSDESLNFVGERNYLVTTADVYARIVDDEQADKEKGVMNAEGGKLQKAADEDVLADLQILLKELEAKNSAAQQQLSDAMTLEQAFVRREQAEAAIRDDAKKQPDVEAYRGKLERAKQAAALLDKEALAQAGDLTIYGQRKNVQLIREDSTGMKSIHYFDLTDANIINSPYFYLQQNDVVNVTPNKAKAQNSSVGSMTTLWFSATSILISLTSLLYNILKN